jgi:hypothetical protein
MGSPSHRISTVLSSSLLCDDQWYPITPRQVHEWVGYFTKILPAWTPQLSTLVDDIEHGRYINPTMMMDMLTRLRDHGRSERRESDRHGSICAMIAVIVRAAPTLYPFIAHYCHTNVAVAHDVVADACWIAIAHGEDTDSKAVSAFWAGSDRLTPRAFQIGFRRLEPRAQGGLANTILGDRIQGSGVRFSVAKHRWICGLLMSEWPDDRLLDPALDLVADDGVLDVFEESSSLALNWLLVTRQQDDRATKRITKLRQQRPDLFHCIDQRLAARASRPDNDGMIVLIPDDQPSQRVVREQTARNFRRRSVMAVSA